MWAIHPKEIASWEWCSEINWNAGSHDCELLRLESSPVSAEVTIAGYHSTKWEEEDTYNQEVRAICVDSDLHGAIGDDVEVECLVWWKSVSARYPIMFKIVRSVLSIFHGPAVESTFSAMDDVINTHSWRMSMDI